MVGLARTSSPAALYHALLDSWNRRDAAGYASLFLESGHVVGFDGSQMSGREQIEATLAAIFADHETGAYVGLVQEEISLAGDMALVRSVCGIVPAGASDLNPALNATQTLLARREAGDWKIVLFQNTPAQFHGRPDLAEQLTGELRQALKG